MDSIVRRWPSLADQLAVATDLYGGHGPELLTAWLDEQTGYVDDLTFARRFSDHVSLPGIAPIDYAHRLLRTGRGEVLGGIRFRGLDVTRPFVDVLAHSFDDLDALGACVAAEWSAFDAPLLRLQTRPGAVSGPGAVLDQTIHVARVDRMTPPDGRIELGDFDDVEEALSLIEKRYRDLEASDAQLAADIAVPDIGDIREWVATGELQAIRAAGSTVGAMAVSAGEIGWIAGDEIQEEVIDAAHANRGYAASAQALWAHRSAADDPGALLIGTIARRNHASRRTAEKSGRPAVLEYVFVQIGNRGR